jgi:2-dehydropantoate 2-reductase
MADVAVIGAGAIGGLLAAELHAAGHRVTLCARTPLERLVVERDGDGRDVPVGAGDGAIALATDPAQVGRHEFALVALKGQDSAAAAPWLAALVGPGSLVAVVQNGIEHRERVGPLAGAAPVLPVLAYAAVERVGTGRLVHRTGDRLVVPDQAAASERIAGLLVGSALHVETAADFRTAAWRKLLSNLAANPLTALTTGRMQIFADEELRALALGLLREGAAVGRAEGAQLADDEPEQMLVFYDGFPPDSGSSMLYDRLAGRALEHDLLTGAVVRRAARHSIDVPLNRAILALLRGLDDALRTASELSGPSRRPS